VTEKWKERVSRVKGERTSHELCSYTLQSHNLYYSQNVIREIKLRRTKWVRRADGAAHKMSVIKPTAKKSLQVPTHMWEDNIKIYLKK